MIKIIFLVDLAMVLGSSAVAYDYIKQSGQSRDLVLEWDEYVATVQLRAINLMEPQPKKRISSLPQIAKAMTTTSMRTMGGHSKTTEEQIAEFTKGEPQLQALVERSRIVSRESWWARIRQKVTDDHSEPRNDRLASIQKRNFPKPRVGIDPSALEGMSAVELYANREIISRGLSTTAVNRMNSVVAEMEAAGIDMSVYTLD
jgi:hypothetical protein